ncbi:isochorismatase family protein [Lentisalinibacter sediminis]|uniref:isochorismatase family protein n=1 Tax=Lentisalinibacter sediminis TaxID=2992237 RepID=UPI00386DD847
MAERLEDEYRQAGFGRALQPGARPALLVVDFVRAYLDSDCPLYAGVEDTLVHCRKLLAGAREAGIPILHTNVAFMPGGIDGGVFYRKVGALRCLDRGSPYGEFADGLEPVDGEPVVTKQYASAFFGTSLASTLTSLGVDTVFIAGLTTSGCIRATAVDAIQHGFLPFVVREAVGDRDPAPHAANLFDLQAKYAEVISLDSALGHLERYRAEPKRP